MRIAVTGSSGFVGRHLVEYLGASGRAVVCISRSTGPQAAGITHHTIGDYRDTAALTSALSGADAVIHLAARAHRPPSASAAAEEQSFREANVVSAFAAASAARAAGCGRFVLVSSIGVHGEHTSGLPFDESCPPAPREPYARSKLEAESAVRGVLDGSATSWTVIRPPLVYGPGCPGNFRLLVALVQRLPVLPFGALRRRRSLIGVRSLCEALAIAATTPVCAARIFVVADGEDVSVATLTRWIAQGLGHPGRISWAVPPGWLRAAAVLAGRRRAFDKLACELTVDPGAFVQATGWRPSLGVREGVLEAARSFRLPERHSTDMYSERAGRLP